VFAVFTVLRTVRIVPKARARNVERLGRYHRTLAPGLNFVIPYVDRVHRAIDLTQPQLAQGDGNTFFVIPSEVTSALRGVAHAFAENPPAREVGAERT
jgi:regulator of protease activity HflC (stomatin/prohibitin superfamily)